MKKDVFTYIISGQAGQGIKKAGTVATNLFSNMKRHVFHMIDYPSLIRGGHNFSVISSSTTPIHSHYMKADLIVALDQRSYNRHKKHIHKNGIIVLNSDQESTSDITIDISSEAKKYKHKDLIKGVSGIAVLSAYMDIDKKQLDTIIKNEYGKDNTDNKKFAHAIYDQAYKKMKNKVQLKHGENKKKALSGNEMIGLGATAAGLDVYFAYPMTPSTSVLHFFANNRDKLHVICVQPESEIAVANMAIGATFTGAHAMVGTSGGGFCLMQEAFSLAGMLESPVLFYLSQRPGPSTGVPTYTEQGELLHALHPGQGEFPRIVASPGSIEESFYLTGELLDIIWRFQTPGILLSEKHLAESSMSVDINLNKVKWAKPKISRSKTYNRYKNTKTGVSPLCFPPSDQTINWNSYEHTETGETTEEADIITKMHVKRLTKLHYLIDYLKNNIKTVNVFGNGSLHVFTFGSTTMSVLEAIESANLNNVTVVQPIYLQPFPDWELKKFKDKKSIVIEQNSSGQLKQLLKDKIGIEPTLSIRQFNGRPLDPIELGKKLKKVA
jgi:2-oxoglutarate ferredoxin oxidoreductase subunit alpha